MMTFPRRENFRNLLLAATILASPLTAIMSAPAAAQPAIMLSVQIAPPPLPVYVQPPIPQVGYMWTPGYWAYGQVGYYWVPGTWVQPPIVGVLWTPPYWGWTNGVYVFNQGYWGPHVGFYGGVNYGYGYGGSGYDGGRWNGGTFAYNRSANNFGTVHVQNAYQAALIVNNHTNTSYVGGEHGLKAEPTVAERSAESETHTPLTAVQTRHVTVAASDPASAASHNNGHPAIAATSRPAEIHSASAARPATSGAVEHPAGSPVQHAAITHRAGPVAVPLAAHPAVVHAVARPAQTAAVHPAVAHPAVAHPAVAHPAPHPVQQAAVHPAAVHAAAPHAAPAHEEKPAQDQKDERK